MPFDFKKYDQKCVGMSPEELQREWQHYTRLISGSATSTAVSGLAIPLTAGVSLIGVGMAAPAIHNARKKREIIEKHLQTRGTTHNTRKRDVLSGVAVSGTIGVVTLGVGSMGADAVATAGAEHGISAIVENETAIKIVTHAALDGAGMGIEHMYTHHVKEREAHKAFQAAGTFQAVANAKAQEAGYAVPPYNNQQVYMAGGSSNAVQPQPVYAMAYDTQVPPPPPYSAATAPPPGFVADTKAPIQHAQDSSQSYYPGGAQQHYPTTYGQQAPTPQYSSQNNYGPAPVQYRQPGAYQQPPPPEKQSQQSNSASYGQVQQETQHTTPVAELQHQQYPTNLPLQQNQGQNHQAEQQAQPQYGAYDMKAIGEALPAVTPAVEPQQQYQHHQPQQQQTQRQEHQQYHQPYQEPQQPQQYQHETQQNQGHQQYQPQFQRSQQEQKHQQQAQNAAPEPQLVVSSIPETPVLYAPRPATVQNPVPGLFEYGNQPSPAPQQAQQPPAQQHALPEQQQAYQTPQISGPIAQTPQQWQQTQPSAVPPPSTPQPPTPASWSYTPAPSQASTATIYFPPPPEKGKAPSAQSYNPMSYPPPPPPPTQPQYNPASYPPASTPQSQQPPHNQQHASPQQYQYQTYPPQQQPQPGPNQFPPTPPSQHIPQQTTQQQGYFSPAPPTQGYGVPPQQNSQKQWNTQPQFSQMPYTPAATPASQYGPQAPQGYFVQQQ
ncbi:hypothetical protein B0H66DRAFT_549795 [Apodospora peruviana]|uniref:Uncharacterized protein n=1 Tax=Apodospora peruviana TaxID=516989 RepID=A0AAE0MAZ3_9PEZI|nr:hypothetical protein B0H66DRAFT_549795 [Apodospora peruviana]